MLSGFDRDNGALDRHRPDQKLYSPLPSLALRDNADANAKARYAASLRRPQVSPPLLLDLAALSTDRVVATSMGASVGAVEANYFGVNIAAFMLTMFFIAHFPLAF